METDGLMLSLTGLFSGERVGRGVRKGRTAGTAGAAEEKQELPNSAETG